MDLFFALFVKERGSVGVFCELSFGAIIWVDVRVWLMLWDTWRWVLKTSECFRDIFKHGDADSSTCVVPVNVHAQVLLTIPIQFAFVVFIEDRDKVFGMFGSNILDAKVVHAYRERYRPIVMVPEAWHEGALAVAMFVEAYF